MAIMYSYTSLSKSTCDLLSKGYPEASTMVFDFKSSKDTFTFRGKAQTCSATSRTGNASVVASLSQGIENMGWRIKRTSSGISLFEVNYVPGQVSEFLKLKGIAELSYSSKKFRPYFTGDLVYAMKNLNFRLKVAENPFTIAGAIVIGNEQFAIAGKTEYEWVTKNVNSAGITAFWTTGNTRVSVECDKEMKVKGYLQQKVNDKLFLAAIANQKDMAAEVGGSYLYKPNLMLKAKTNTAGDLDLSAQHVLDDKFCLHASAKGKVFQTDLSKFNFGLRLNINYKGD